MKNEKKITKYKRPFKINVGVVIFIIIFIYIVYNVFTYFTEVHISVYEVEQGTMAANNIYNGFVIRDESTYTCEYSGTLNYYVKEYSRVGHNDLIYSVDQNGNVSDKLNELKQDGMALNASVAEEVDGLLDDFHTSYNSKDFYQVYNLKEQLSSLINEALSLDALSQISAYADTAEGNNTFHRIRAEKPGIISYYMDGYEHITIDNFQSSMLDESTYNRTSLKSNTDIMAGSVAYKMINSEKWHIILPISTELAEELKDNTVIRIRFLKDSKKMYAECSIKQDGDACYLILTLKNAMIRYAADRYLEVELLLTEKTGLKIPNSAITQKEFYTVPITYFSEKTDTEPEGLLIERRDKNGKITTEMVYPTIYYQTENLYYIDSEKVQAGDIVKLEDSLNTYVIGDDTASLEGVYNINKGYAVFKQIEVLFQNEEYSIVKTGTSYGIALYDHIALDGSKIAEDELIK